MLRFIDAMPDTPFSGDSDSFDLERWKAYMDAALPEAKELCLQDMTDCVSAGYPWEDAFLPVDGREIRVRGEAEGGQFLVGLVVLHVIPHAGLLRLAKDDADPSA